MLMIIGVCILMQMWNLGAFGQMSPELFLMQRRLKKRGTDPKGLEKSRTYTKM
jgi:hypothetical protein